jgi:hypothetical protein
MKKEDILFFSLSFLLFFAGIILTFTAKFLIQKQQEKLLTLTQISLPVKKSWGIEIGKIGPEKIEDFEKKEGVFKNPEGEFERIYVFSYEKTKNKSSRIIVALGKLKTEDSKIKEQLLSALLLSKEKLKQNAISPIFFITLSEKGGFEVEKIKCPKIGEETICLNYKGRETNLSNYFLGFHKKDLVVWLYNGGKEASLEIIVKIAKEIEKEI